MNIVMKSSFPLIHSKMRYGMSELFSTGSHCYGIEWMTYFHF